MIPTPTNEFTPPTQGNPKTTIFGSIAGIAGMLASDQTGVIPPQIKMWAGVGSAVSMILMGYFSRDKKKTPKT